MHRNKQIAIILSDTLRSIGLQSLLTDYFPPVEVTHRKNITAKLGIKTVSGLTFYAIMNGIISGDDIEL